MVILEYLILLSLNPSSIGIGPQALPATHKSASTKPSLNPSSIGIDPKANPSVGSNTP